LNNAAFSTPLLSFCQHRLTVYIEKFALSYHKKNNLKIFEKSTYNFECYL